MDSLLLVAVIVVVTILYQRHKRQNLNDAIDSPITPEEMQAIPIHTRAPLADADIVVRDYLKASRNHSSVHSPLRPRSQLPHAVAVIKQSLILVTAFRLRTAKNSKELLRQLREAYSALGFFPPTPAEAEEQWENSAKDEWAVQEASRARVADTNSLAGAMREAGRLGDEFDDEVLEFLSSVVKAK